MKAFKPIMLGTAVLLLVPAILLAIGDNNEGLDNADETTAVRPPDVAVMDIAPGTHRSTINAFGEARPRFDVTLVAEVSGRVLATEAAADVGSVVAAGELLLRIEDTSYVKAGAEMDRALADARVSLLQEQRRAERAVKEWEAAALDGEPNSDLVMRVPQLEAANAAIQEAKAGVAEARRQLENTRVRAPFDAVVTERLVSPGSYVQNGTSLLRIYGTERAEIRIPLTERQWRVAKADPGTAVSLQSIDGTSTWEAAVVRTENHLDGNNRQRALVVAIDNPLQQSSPLLPGTFVNAKVPTIELNTVMRIPAGAFGADGYLWSIDDDDRLVRIAATPLFEGDDAAFVEADETGKDLRIVLRPLPGYVAGATVTPVVTLANE